MSVKTENSDAEEGSGEGSEHGSEKYVDAKESGGDGGTTGAEKTTGAEGTAGAEGATGTNLQLVTGDDPGHDTDPAIRLMMTRMTTAPE